MALHSPTSATQKEAGEETAARRDGRLHAIQKKYHTYFRVTLDILGVASKQQTEELKSWVFDVRPDEEEKIKDLEQSWNLYYSKYLESAHSLDHEFTAQLTTALEENIISPNSAERWERDRFRNRNVGYKEKEKWVREEMPQFMKRWRAVAKERKEFIADPRAANLRSDPIFSILWEDKAFLDLHFEKKKSLVDSAKAWMGAVNGKTELLYAVAERMLEGAAERKYLAGGKIGMWLKRIFQVGASSEKIDTFVNGTSMQSLSSLIDNWRNIKERYDHVRNKIRERGESAAARGFTLVSEQKFLGLHYESRLKYMEEAEQRIGEAKNVNEELPIFLQIRHVMDIHDWDEAHELIVEAQTMELGEKDRNRLNSMDAFVKQFSGQTQSPEGGNSVMESEHRIDQIVENLGKSHSELQETVGALLEDPNANLALLQLRWICYNNKWCRTHGYLDDDIARKGASEENKRLTKIRAKRGEDIGRNNVVRAETSGQAFLRKDEHAKNTATLLHVNVEDKDSKKTLEIMMKKEQPKEKLYWTTLNATDKNGNPKSANWHNDLLMMLTELRYHTKILKTNGRIYSKDRDKKSESEYQTDA